MDETNCSVVETQPPFPDPMLAQWNHECNGSTRIGDVHGIIQPLLRVQVTSSRTNPELVIHSMLPRGSANDL